MKGLKEFGETAQNLSKNPIGIIGLFLVLVYAVAAIVLTMSQTEDRIQRLLLTSFLVIFPILVLAAFFELVTKHHKKLYAPSDFRDEENFMDKDTQEVYPSQFELIKSQLDESNKTTIGLVSGVHEQIQVLLTEFSKENSKNNKNDDNNLIKLEGQVQSTKELIETTIKWSRYPFWINVNLENYNEIFKRLIDSGLTFKREFGDHEKPSLFVLTFGRSVPIENIKEAISLLIPFGIEAICISKEKNNYNNIHVGAYNYKYGPVLLLSQNIINVLSKPDLTKKEFLEIYDECQSGISKRYNAS
ncbi:hypothetical protein P5G65_04780 [Paenibacillus chondroitinus]|uniref:Uncharacterized protein n=1 Tax=Paenibacillus chondroitinus TaxID=59842 RepID=A0ABU6D642_9BACL|nr:MULTISPECIES: hypothetical protein [Paenibacillus]MCY9658137.1 hypothetical protein [Paenibacillus anseongense]MEB4793200.1 hypothetical protein [Paenibacillus chondroitinus]